MRRSTRALVTAALAVCAGAAVASAVCLILITLSLYEAAHVLLELCIRSLEESP